MANKRKPKVEKLADEVRELTPEEAEAAGGGKHIANIKWTPAKATVGAVMEEGSDGKPSTGRAIRRE